MFSKVLIANRGEIACRIIRTARRMGVATVAVHSDADARAPFVALADEAVPIGPSPAAQSYLVADKIIAACKATGAEAVHPGYGFLSERAAFVEALEAAGIAFIGPPAAAIAAMGDKLQSKRLASAAGVNTVPGFLGEIESADHALRIAGAIGYPVMLKASAGGGGKGMRLAHGAAELREGYDSVRREAAAAFGDDRLLLEKFIASPRHIEIQVLGDRHGTILHLGERECSIQRRHQKVVEEAPSPFVGEAMRAAMGAQAVALARAVGYHSAGTVELIVDGSDPTGQSFYFLEMNTRLQVEHPVTEAVTGIDLVEQMIRVAAGEKLGFGQDDIRLRGHAIETRIYAEDPYRGFLPSTGRLVRYCPPPVDARQQPPAPGSDARRHLRLDDGVAEGGEVSIFYDPMIAKLVTHAPGREEAARMQVAALDRFRIEGPGHNIDFLSAIMQHPRFLAGKLTTGFIAEEWPDGFAGAEADLTRRRIVAAIAAGIECSHAARARSISGQIDAARPATPDWLVTLDGEAFAVTLGEGHALVDGQRIDGHCDWQPGAPMAQASGPGEAALGLMVAREGRGWRIVTGGRRYRAMVLPGRLQRLAALMPVKRPPDTSRRVACPMPGVLVRLHVAAGEAVQPGQALATVEAMKMENVLRAQRAGTVGRINAAEGATLALDEVILELD